MCVIITVVTAEGIVQATDGGGIARLRGSLVNANRDNAKDSDE